ncbi:hypothetical protein BH23BAC1_BH23BAC1_32720 [soil metagenome]
MEELTLTLKNLLQLRNKIAERFIQVWQLGADKELPTEAGNPSFFDRFTHIVESNISDESFGVNEMLR